MDWHKAYVLRTRPYRETSLLVDVFSADAGRVTLVARGAKRPQYAQKALLQPFIPLTLAWRGQRDLKQLADVVTDAPVLPLSGMGLFCGFYLNELLLRLLQAAEPLPELFEIYAQTLAALRAVKRGQPHATPQLEIALRLFERDVLRCLGYALPLTYEAQTQTAIAADDFYYYYPERGFVAEQVEDQASASQPVFCGNSLLALASGQLPEDDSAILLDCKRLLRRALQPLLGLQPLRSRELYRQMMASQTAQAAAVELGEKSVSRRDKTMELKNIKEECEHA